MKKLLFTLLFPGLVSAQTLSLSTPPVQITPGGIVTVAVNFADSTPSANVAMLQWALSTPTGWTAAPAAIGTPGTVDSVACDTQAQPIAAGFQTCVAGGIGPTSSNPAGTLNASSLSNGAIANVAFTIPSSAAPGPYTISLSNVQGVTSATTPSIVTINVGAALTITIPPLKYDLNGDGLVNQTDVDIAVSDLLTKNCSGTFAAVGDGKCGLLDVFLEVEAALGLIH